MDDILKRHLVITTILSIGTIGTIVFPPYIQHFTALSMAANYLWIWKG